MKFVVALLVVAGLAGASWGQVVPSIGDYAAMPNMSNVRISPNGEKLVFISGETWEDRNIVVFTLDQSEPPIVIDAHALLVRVTEPSPLSDQSAYAPSK